MAAPMVSGAVALLLERYPNLTPNQVKGVLMASARSLPGGLPEVDATGAIKRMAYGSIPVANAGLTPNTLVDASSGDIDYTRSSWSRSSWSSASGAQSADWARSSWSRSSWSSSGSGSGSVDPSRSSWSRSSWSTSWTK
jgi:serine protease AprX